MANDTKKHTPTAPEALKADKRPALRLVKDANYEISPAVNPVKLRLGGQLLARLNALSEQIDRDVELTLG